MDIQRSAAAILANPSAKEATLGQMNVPWFMLPFFPTLLHEANLSPADQALVESFSREGYVVIDAKIPDLDAFSTRLIQDLAPLYRGRGRIQDAWKENADAKTLALLPEIDRVLRLLYQRDPIPFQTLNFALGTEQHTHSDTVHFHCIPHGFMCGVWIALEDINADAGPLHVYPASHKMPAWDFHDLGLPSGRESYQRYEECMQAYVEAVGFKKHIVTMKKGQAVIWAATLLHGGEPIHDRSKTRHSQVTHYYFSDCLYYTPMLSDPYIGRMQMRTIMDIRTGKVVPNMYGGKMISSIPSAATIAPAAAMASKSVLRNLLRKARKWMA
ncbi:MAG: phytanoyl-CoA dioxygenase [Candidatus Peregrinibacteria bacterium Greene0416_62]|nr:MAG: phytanoyl-CoA dioxygenase [Candidatus Peregrinibacteria bacterium Greene0416_62]TSC96777.1 MAG: phytanoyl-CoA dioxygenase [Candidatus Peregrinibacteria bacterium Greene1014_49]